MPKTGAKNLEWINANSARMDELEGSWVALAAERGILSSDSTLPGALRKAHLPKGSVSPYVFKVPSLAELGPFDLSTQWGRVSRKNKG